MWFSAEGTENHCVSARVAHELHELVRQQVQLHRHRVQLRAGQEAAVGVEGREVEVERRVAGAAVSGPDVEVRLRPLDEVDHVRVRDHHTLRHPGGARGEQDVRDVAVRVLARDGALGAGIEVGERRVGGQARGRLVVEPGDAYRADAGALHELLDQRLGLATGEQHAALERGQDLGHARRRVVQIHRGVGAVGLERAEHRGDRERRLRQQQRDAVTALGSRARAAGEPAGCCAARAHRTRASRPSTRSRRPAAGARACSVTVCWSSFTRGSPARRRAGSPASRAPAPRGRPARRGSSWSNPARSSAPAPTRRGRRCRPGRGRRSCSC